MYSLLGQKYSGEVNRDGHPGTGSNRIEAPNVGWIQARISGAGQHASIQAIGVLVNPVAL